MLGEHLGARPPLRRVAGAAQAALADQRLGQVGELGQVPGGADRALGGDHGEQAQAEQLEESARQVGPDARVPGGQGPGPQQEDGADGRVVEGRPGARGVRADDGTLQPGQVARADRRVGQRAEAGVDPVDGGVSPGRGFHDGAAEFHGGGHVRAELGAGVAAGHVDDILDFEAVAGDDHSSHG